MGKIRLIEYRPGRWIKVDTDAGVVVGPATPAEVKAWQATHEVQRPLAAPGSAALDEAAPAEPEGRPSEPDKSAPQKPDPKPVPEEPDAQPPEPQEPDPEPVPEEPDPRPQQGPVPPLGNHYRITSTFADHQNRTPPSTAPGLDFACPMGTAVRAWDAGRVIRSRWSNGGGRSLWIQHGKGIRTYYAHLNAVWVLEGEKVAPAQKIGESGTTGHSTGPHLHFSVTHGGSYVDPSRYLPPQDGST
jgi:murein DD-endopeptidase MepM/ murein hydrolase activator NlpD